MSEPVDTTNNASDDHLHHEPKVRERKPWTYYIKKQKLLAVVALTNPLSLIACFYTLATDEWWTVQFSSTMHIARGIFRVCTTALDTVECHNNDISTDFVLGDCRRDAQEMRMRMRVALAFHIIGGLFTLCAWMLSAHGYTKSSDLKLLEMDKTSILTTCNNGIAFFSFLISTSIMTSTFYLGWYTCGKSMCEHIGGKRYCNEDMGYSLIAAYLSTFMAGMCFIIAGIRAHREFKRANMAREFAAQKINYEDRRTTEPFAKTHEDEHQRKAGPAGAKKNKGPARARSSTPTQSDSPDRVKEKMLTPADWAAIPKERKRQEYPPNVVSRFRRYFDVYAPDHTDADIVAMLGQYRGDWDALSADLVEEHGPELTSIQRKEFFAEKEEVLAFCKRRHLDRSAAEISQMLLQAIFSKDMNKGFVGMWDVLEAEADGRQTAQRRGPANPVAATFAKRPNVPAAPAKSKQHPQSSKGVAHPNPHAASPPAPAAKRPHKVVHASPAKSSPAKAIPPTAHRQHSKQQTSAPTVARTKSSASLLSSSSHSPARSSEQQRPIKIMHAQPKQQQQQQQLPAPTQPASSNEPFEEAAIEQPEDSIYYAREETIVHCVEPPMPVLLQREEEAANSPPAEDEALQPTPPLEDRLYVLHLESAEDWAPDAESGLLWSDALAVYYDGASMEYFDPAQQLWFEPESKMWHVVGE